METIAALYVQKGGAYFGLDGVDPWDEERDARLYDGPWPVVAHPPCSRWCQLAHVNQKRYGHRVGDDGGCFAAALDSVRRFGGVLEHPARTYAWPAHGLTRPPPGGGWTRVVDDPGWVCEVSQCAYGHPARKLTWLYFAGERPPSLDWRVPEASARVGHCRDGSKLRHLGKKEASATPAAFRDELIAMARSAR
jgi:hypothetical protein